jgi:SAM-dependent methyltransferase
MGHIRGIHPFIHHFPDHLLYRFQGFAAPGAYEGGTHEVCPGRLITFTPNHHSLPSVKYKTDLALDSPERTMLHREIILNKKSLRELYEGWYRKFQNESNDLPDGIKVEIGSGGGFLKKQIPTIICSDIIELPTNDMTFSALEMPFLEDSVSGIYMVDTMHHIPDSKVFLQEVTRVLKMGGQLIMIEPSNTIWSRFIYKNFHHEPFNPEGDWFIPPSGPLSGANGALPWIVFIRDKDKFKKTFPNLTIEAIEYLNPLSYLLSGGVSHKQFIPDFLFPAVTIADRILSKAVPQLSMFMMIKIKKVR